MKIILKFLLKNIKEKKLRTALVIFSVTLSTALLFSTITINGTLAKMMEDRMRKFTGNSEIVIQSDPKSNIDPFFDVKPVENIEDQLDYVIGVVSGNGIYQVDEDQYMPVRLGGYDLLDLNRMHGMSFEEFSNHESYTGNQVIIGSVVAKEYDLKIGYTMTVLINGGTHEFKVYGIAKEKGLFEYDGQSLTVIMPKETLATIYDNSGKVNRLYIKTIDEEDTKEVLNHFSDVYKDLIVKTTLTKEEIKAGLSQITTMFSIMLASVVFISIFIIYTTFKVISFERLPIVGTFRSIGSTKKMTNLILLGESIMYGLIGGILGCILGIGILYIMMNTLAYNAFTGIKYDVEMVFGISHLLIAFLTAIVLSIISSFLPILKVNKVPLRDIIFTQLKDKNIRSILRGVIGFIFIILNLLLLTTKPNQLVGPLMLMLSTVGLVMVIPLISDLFVHLFQFFYRFIFGNIGVVSIKNIQKNKTILNNITLLTIGIAGMIMINTVSLGVGKEVLNVFSKADYDIVMSHPKGSEETLNEIENLPGVESAYGYYQTNDIKLVEHNDYVWMVLGIESEYFDYWNYEFVGDRIKILNEFPQGRNILITIALRDKYELEQGDEITLLLNKKEVSYKVSGFINSMMNNGDFIMIPEAYFIEDTNAKYKTEILIKTNEDPIIVSKEIEDLYRSEMIFITTMDEMYEKNMESNNQVFTLLGGFSIITMVIGIFGIFNNFVINFISRKRSLAIYRSTGMSKKQLLKMLSIESLSVGLIGGLSGVLGGIIFVKNAEYLTVAIMELPVKFQIPWFVMVVALFSAILMSMIASLSPALKSSKQSIIDSIKYE